MRTQLFDKGKLSHIETLALRFIWQWFKIANATRPIDTKTLTAELQGMCKAANAMGVGHTESHVSITVHEVMRNYPAPAPKYVGDQTERDTWEYESLTALAAALQEIS